MSWSCTVTAVLGGLSLYAEKMQNKLLLQTAGIIYYHIRVSYSILSVSSLQAAIRSPLFQANFGTQSAIPLVRISNHTHYDNAEISISQSLSQPDLSQTSGSVEDLRSVLLPVIEIGFTLSWQAVALY